jgi:hypothetical protein
MAQTNASSGYSLQTATAADDPGGPPQVVALRKERESVFNPAQGLNVFRAKRWWPSAKTFDTN